LKNGTYYYYACNEHNYKMVLGERESKAYMSPLFFKPILFAGVVKVEGGLWFAGSVNFN
jgi:hypothetical protein